MDILKSLPWRARSPVPAVVKGELLHRETRHHWMKRAPAFCIYILLMVAGLSAFWFLSPASDGVSLSFLLPLLGGIVIVQHWFFYIMLGESSTELILTNKRVLYLYHRLWIADEMDELAIMNIKLVKVHKNGLIRQIFDYGELSCLFDIDAGKTFPYVPSPGTWAVEIEKMINIS